MLFAIVSLLIAQPPKSPDWKVTTGNPVKWLKVTPTGFIVAASGNALYGINPSTKSIAWQIENMGNINEDSYENLEGSPLFIIKEGGNDKISLVNSFTGKKLYSSVNDGFTKINKRSFFIPQGAVLIDGQIGDVHALTLIDMDNGTQKWIKKFTDEKSGGMMAKITVVAKPILDMDNNLLYSTKEKLFRINSSNGDIMWEKKFDKKVGATYVTPDNKQVIVITGSLSNAQKEEQAESSMVVSTTGNVGTFLINMIKISDGSSVWAEPLKIKSKFSGVMLGETDFFLFHSTGCNILDYAAGKSKWEKDAKVPGDEVLNMTSTDKGYFITTAVNKSITYFKCIDANGNSVWKKQPSTGYGVQEVRVTNKGIFYLSPGRADVIDVNTGEATWIKDKNINFRPDNGIVFFYDPKADAYIVYNNGNLYIFDLAKLESKILVKELFCKGNEVFDKIERLNEGYLLSSSQNLSLVDFSGNIVYQKYYEAPELGLAAQLALGMAGTVAGVIAVDYAAGSEIAGTFGGMTNDAGMKKLSNDYAKKAAVAGSISGGAFEAMNTRFKASANTKSDVLIMTKPINTAGSASLVKVSKASGNAELSIGLSSKKPVFAVDPIDNKMFLVSDDNEISCFEL
jgi:outer membrane protein assembly factor BamB